MPKSYQDWKTELSGTSEKIGIVMRKKLFNGCLISSISHAIMTNVYPDLAFEQSWDNNNFSIRSCEGIRGTITFLENKCVGAIRNENRKVWYGFDDILERIKHFPEELVNLAKTETLLYLLDNDGDRVAPAVTSMFYCDSNSLRWASNNSHTFSEDFHIFTPCCLNHHEAIAHWVDYYDMDQHAIELLNYLLNVKAICPQKRIFLHSYLVQLIPGSSINKECLESLSELDIYVKDM